MTGYDLEDLVTQNTPASESSPHKTINALEVNDPEVDEDKEEKEEEDAIPLGQKSPEKEQIKSMSIANWKTSSPVISSQLPKETWIQKRDKMRRTTTQAHKSWRDVVVADSNQDQEPNIKPTGSKPGEEVPICRHYARGTCRHGLLGRTKKEGILACKFRHPKACQK